MHSGRVLCQIQNKQGSIDIAEVEELVAYPFGFILNLSPEIEIKYGTSINVFLDASYNERYDFMLSLMYLEKINEDTPFPMRYKPIP